MNPRSPLLPMPSVEEAIEAGDLEALAYHGRRICRQSTMPAVRALLAAGWALALEEHPNPDPEPFSWWWRRPPKGRAKRGRLFKSTDRAYNALMREAGDAVG